LTYRSKNLSLSLSNKHTEAVDIEIKDNGYKRKDINIQLAAGATRTVDIDVSKSFGWYDLSLKIKGIEGYERRYAGRIEDGKPGKTDPMMGGIV
jgi:phospholipase C